MIDTDLPDGFHVIGTHNFTLFQEWQRKAEADPTVRRFLSGSGWDNPASEAPKNDWENLMIVSERTQIHLKFDRSAPLEISVGMWTLGDQKEFASGKALLALLAVLRRYRFFRRVRSGCKVCNTASMKLHRHIFGDPWGIEPDGVWDEVEGFCDQAHFSAKLSDILERFPPKAEDGHEGGGK